MKKLLSICFLSILLGLFSFSVQAQNNSCKSGFWIENLQPEQLTGVVNIAPDGTLDLSHTLGTSRYGANGMVLGNARVGESELYELHFCNTCGLDPKTRVSVDWLLYRDGQLVNGNLSDYATLEIYTEYRRLNQQGECQSIHWLGGVVNDASGFCNQQFAPDMFSGVPSNDLMNYPGSMQVMEHYPASVFTNNNVHSADGPVRVWDQNLNYFNLDFFDQARTVARITWKQVGNYSLVMRVRQMLGGTEYNNLYWNENQATDFVGGHMACCGPIIAQDSIHGLVKYDTLVEVCEDANEQEPFKYGNPEYTFSNDKGSMPDTLVVWMHNEGEGDCEYNELDSLARLHFYIRVNPDLKSKSKEICKCDEFTSTDLVKLLDTIKSDGMVSAYFEWCKFANPTTAQLNNPNNWVKTIPTPTTDVVGTYVYYVRQTTVYKTIECTGENATVTLKVNPIPTPTVTASKTDFCNEQTYSNPTLRASVSSNADGCMTYYKWYVKNGNKWDSVGKGASFTVKLDTYKPTTNVDKTVTFAVASVNGNSPDLCESDKAEISLYFHRTPETQLTYDPNVCPMPDTVRANLTVKNTKNTNDVHTNAYNYTVKIRDWDNDNHTQTIVKPNNALNLNFYEINKPLNMVCNEEYKLYYVTTDNFGCAKKDTVTFKPVDTENPTVTPATAVTYINACAVNNNTYPKFDFENDVKSLSDFQALIGKDYTTKKDIEVKDNCSINWAKTEQVDEPTVSGNICEAVTIRTYTFYDYCDNTVTFKQYIVAHDSVKPYFDFTSNNNVSYVSIDPIPAGNCQYDAPDSATFVNAVKAFLKDNCTDTDYLISSLKFSWENLQGTNPIGEKNIFREYNHLTVNVTITDRCGNDSTRTIITLDRPDTLSIKGGPHTLEPICENTTTTILFDTTLIQDDTVVGPFLTYQYQWSVLNGREVVFGTPNAKETTVAPVGSGDFYIVMTVTNGNGCTATSKPYLLHVNPTPNVAIYKDVRNGATSPYCPTYGNMTVYAADATTGEKLHGLTYTWSGESVNINPTIDTTWVKIVPDSCKYDYVVKVVATDAIGCFATAYDTIHVDDLEGPVFTGVLNDSVVEVETGCKMYIPDFTGFFNAENVESTCWQWTDIKGNISQSPAHMTGTKRTEMTEDTEITLTLTTPCGASSQYKVWARVPDNMPKVTLVSVNDSTCERDITADNPIAINATVTAGTPEYKYTWYRNDEELTGTAYVGASITAVETSKDNENTVINYSVAIEDENGCPATANIDVTVLYQGSKPDTITNPNTLCVGHDGSLVLTGVLKDYTYKFQGQVKTQDVPEHQNTTNLTMVFWNCYSCVDEPLVIITPDGCVDTMYITIAEANKNKPTKPAVLTAAPTDCFQADGKITVTTIAGVTYYVSKNDEDYAVLSDNPITNVKPEDIYKIYCVNNVTGCTSDTTTTNVPRYNSGFTVNASKVTDNTSCTDIKNGSIKLTDAANYYVVTPNVTNSTDTIYKGFGNHVVDSLAPATYKVYEKNVATDCDAVKTIEIKNSTIKPYVVVQPKPNYFCNPDTANGGFTLTVRKTNSSGAVMPASDYTYEVKDNQENVVAPEKYNSLYQGTYSVKATSTLGCVSNLATFEVKTRSVQPKVTLATTKNNYCDQNKWDGTLKVTISKPSTASSTDQMGSKFTINLTGTDANGNAVDTTVNEKTSPYTFSNLNGGSYVVEVTTEYGCSSLTRTSVDQYELADLVMYPVKNTMCEGTFEKPGNGQIVVVTPRNTSSRHYSYSYQFAEETTMDVPYNDPLSYTGYWFAAAKYRVEVTEIETGCKISDTITVQDSLFYVAPEFTYSPNTNCEGAYNGKITVSKVNSTNENGKFLYKLEDGEFQSNNTFTGLKEGTYNIVIKDTTVNCEYNATAVLENGSECAPVITVKDSYGKEAEEFHYCVGETVDLTATAQAADGCDEGEYEYRWFVDCHSGYSADNNINVLTDEAPFCCHYTITAKSLATGCTQTKDVLVCIENIPPVVVSVNNSPVVDNTAEICQNVDANLHVNNSYTEAGKVKNIDFIEWTNAIHSNSFDTLLEAGSLKGDTAYSFCIDVISEFGCPNRGIFTLRVNPVYNTVVNDTVCTQFILNTENDEITYALSQDEMYAPKNIVFDGTDDEYPLVTLKSVSGCDSIVEHHVTFMGLPQVTAIADTGVCQNSTFAELFTAANVVIKNAADTVLTFNNTTVTLDSIIRYNGASNAPQALNITCTSGVDSCETVYTLYFYVNDKPEIIFNFNKDAYCATDEMIITAGVDYHTRTYPGQTLQLIVIDSTDANNVKEEILKTYDNATVDVTQTITALAKYGAEKVYIGFRAINSCDTTYTLKHVRVDSSVVKLTPITLCEGASVDVDAVLGQYKNLKGANTKAWLINGTTSTEVTDNTTISYLQAGYKVTFTGLTAEVCPESKADTVTITVLPKPVLEVKELGQPICMSEIKDSLENCLVNVQNASSKGWKVAGVNRTAINGRFEDYVNETPADTVNASDIDDLIAKASKFFVAEIFYYAKNSCDSITKSLGKTRIVDVPKVTADAEVTICNNWTVDSVVKATNATIDFNNINGGSSHVDTMYNLLVHYSLVRDGAVAVNLSNTNPSGLHPNYADVKNMVLTDRGAQDGDSLRIVAHTSTSSCSGGDTVYIKLNIQTITYKQDTLQAACSGNQLSEFVKVAPEFTGKATVTEESWYIADNADMAGATKIAESDVLTMANNGNYLSYVWKTDCGDSVATVAMPLSVDTTATVAHIDNIKVCEGSAIALEQEGNPIFTVTSTTTVSDTTFAINTNDNVISDLSTYGFKTTDTMLIITVTNECGDAVDTANVKVNPLPAPQISGPARACENTEVTLTIDNYSTESTYVWKDSDGNDVTVTDNGDGTYAYTTPSEDGIVELTVVETINATGCSAVTDKLLEMNVTNNPQFIFEYEGEETHHITGIQTSETEYTNYTWKISQMCLNPDTLVYVNFYIYHNDTLIDNSKLSNYFNVQQQAVPQSQGGGQIDWIGSDFIAWTNANGSPNAGFTTYYGASTPFVQGNNVYAGNHFPHSTLGTLNNNTYSSFYLHFFNDRDVNKQIVPILIPGEYKIRYELWSTSHNEIYSSDVYQNADLGTQHIGGQNAKATYTNGTYTVLSLLATDSLLITVEGEEIVNETPNQAPQTAPSITNVTSEEIVTPTMDVWPNPASTVTTTFKARIHNMSGNAEVLVTDMAGRPIFGDKTFIDSDDFLYECSINNLTQGFFMMSVRTKDGVVTKKVIVKR